MWSLILQQSANCLKRSFIVNSSIIYVTSIVKSPLEDQHVRLNLLPFHSILFEDMISTTPQSNMSFYKPIPRPFWLFGWAAKSQSYGCIGKLSGEIIVQGPICMSANCQPYHAEQGGSKDLDGSQVCATNQPHPIILDLESSHLQIPIPHFTYQTKLNGADFLHISCPYQDLSIFKPFMVGTHPSGPL